MKAETIEWREDGGAYRWTLVVDGMLIASSAESYIGDIYKTIVKAIAKPTNGEAASKVALLESGS